MIPALSKLFFSLGTWGHEKKLNLTPIEIYRNYIEMKNFEFTLAVLPGAITDLNKNFLEAIKCLSKSFQQAL